MENFPPEQKHGFCLDTRGTNRLSSLPKYCVNLMALNLSTGQGRNTNSLIGIQETKNDRQIFTWSRASSFFPDPRPLFVPSDFSAFYRTVKDVIRRRRWTSFSFETFNSHQYCESEPSNWHISSCRRKRTSDLTSSSSLEPRNYSSKDSP